MKNKNIYASLLLPFVLLFAASCSDSNKNADGTSAEDGVMVLNIEDAQAYQTVEHFGASDAWSCQFVGNWPDAKKNAIADLLFSQDNDPQGNPKGIGLSLWRFNIGAGSAEQGSASGIGDDWRRAPSFLKSDGTYDWNGQQAQVWFANAAKQRGVSKLLLFPNSPHVNFTRNGKAFTSSAQSSNLASDKFDAFAEYLATVTEGMQNMGLTVDYISPVNEPQWDWADGGQEGTPFFNNEIAQITQKLNQKLEQKNLTSKITLAESGQINYLYEVGNKQGRADQINDFFNSTSANYVGNLSKLEKVITGHSYFTTSPFNTMKQQREQLNTAVNAVSGLKYWMSEYCILGDNAGEIDGNGRDLGISPALYLARVIHSDLVYSNAAAWHWWIAISPYDYKDGLVYVDKQQNDGNFYESKMLWAMGNYSHFIRPGYQRVKVTNPANGNVNQSFLYSAYKDPATGKLVTVVINTGTQAVSFKLTKNSNAINGTLTTYTTSADKDLAKGEVADGETVQVPSRSIVTIVSQ